MSGYVDVVFGGPPGPVSGRFVEAEDENRRSIKLGEWLQRDDGYWVLRIPTPTPGAQRVVDERRRQVDEEGFDAEHDDGYLDDELLRAAACYVQYELSTDTPFVWPWADEWWKPSDDPVRNLTKAGALIAAEIDRLLRLRARKEAT